MTGRPLQALVAAVCAVAVAACGGSSSGGARGGSVTVFAAASLTDAFNGLAQSDARFSFAGSQDLVSQIQNGAPADVIATADTTTIAQVADQLESAPKTFARNSLVIVTAPGNPQHLTTLADLANPKVQVVLADPSVPAGKYADQALSDAHVTLHPKSLELDVRSVLTKVEVGEADAGIVYVTDAKSAGAKVSSTPIADSPIATYQIGALDKKGESFVALVLSPSGQSVLHRYGFLSP